MAGFITILTEALPAGLLPQIAAGLAVSDSLAGQLVTVYAVGSLAAAIPLTAATQGIGRRPLLLSAVAGFALANTVTAVSGSYGLTMLARLVAGVSAGLVWALLAGYAARMAPPARTGRAIAIAMVGTPLALSIGVPVGTALGALIGWRACFALLSGLAGLLMIWLRAALPDFPGRWEGGRLSLRRVAARPGVRPVLLVTLTFVLAHNILYTYVAPFLAAAGSASRTDVVLLVFGAGSLAGIGIVGLLVDRRLRGLTLACPALFGLAVLALEWPGHDPAVLHGAVGLWGLAFGGAATLFQTALAKAAGDAADVAQAMLVTVWNLAIAGGGLVGGVILARLGVTGFAPALLLLLGASLLTVLLGRRHGVPSGPGAVMPDPDAEVPSVRKASRIP